MTESGEESVEPDASNWSNEEVKEFLLRSGTVEKASVQMVVGLGLAGLATEETEPIKAHVMLDYAQGYLEESLRLGTKDRIPLQPAVLSRMFLNLWPLFTDVIAYKRMSEPGDVRKYYRSFLSTIDSQYTQVRSFMSKSFTDRARNARQWELLTAFESAAAVGLLMRQQINDERTGEELALPAVLHPDTIRSNPEFPLLGYWHIDMYGPDEQGEVSRQSGVYLRMRESVPDGPIADPDVSAVWFGTDLALPTDRKNSKGPGTFASPLLVVTELAKDHRHAENLDARGMKLAETLGQRTIGSLIAKPE